MFQSIISVGTQKTRAKETMLKLSKNIPPEQRKRKAIPIYHKTTLTIEEAAELSGIGIHKLRELSEERNCEFVLWNGNRRLFKRRKLEEYLENVYSI